MPGGLWTADAEHGDRNRIVHVSSSVRERDVSACAATAERIQLQLQWRLQREQLSDRTDQHKHINKHIDQRIDKRIVKHDHVDHFDLDDVNSDLEQQHDNKHGHVEQCINVEQHAYIKYIGVGVNKYECIDLDRHDLEQLNRNRD